jgi:O-antigen/teichoic acid export membrane protein
VSLKKNIAANYISQIYSGIIGILTVPLYIKYMDSEAYGLIGFFGMLQAWFNLLDVGLSSTISRQTARFHAGALPDFEFRSLVVVLEKLFLLIAIIGGVILFVFSDWLASSWLKAVSLTNLDLIISLKIIAIVVALRWICGFYRGIIVGSERLIWISNFNSSIATGRFLMVLPVIILVNNSPIFFFGFQLLLSVIEIIALRCMAYRLVPKISDSSCINERFEIIKPFFSFAWKVAFTSTIWIFVTQIDKLVLSKFLSLSDYGYFSVVAMVASGISMVIGPITGVILPRITRIYTESSNEAFLSLYHQATQLVVVIALPITLVLAVFPHQVLWAWTGDVNLADRVSPTLSLYAIGYGILQVGGFPYLMQYAKGDLRLHLIGSILFLLLMIPIVIISTLHLGIKGAGLAWLICNLIYFLCWTPIIHKKFMPGLHLRWLAFDIFLPTLVAVFMVTFIMFFWDWSEHRLMLTFQLIIAGFMILGVSYLSASRLIFFRNLSLDKLRL